MLRNNEGLTSTYNHFHDSAETSNDLLELRRIHGEMDPPPSGKLSPVLLTTRGLEEMTSAALQRGCQS
jgi:hypothetical protein